MTRRLIYRNDRKTFQERGIDGEKVTEYISENKDVDGLTTITAGKLSRGETDIFVPCTPRGCMELISRAGLDLTGKTAVVLGRSKVGSSLRILDWVGFPPKNFGF